MQIILKFGPILSILREDIGLDTPMGNSKSLCQHGWIFQHYKLSKLGVLLQETRHGNKDYNIKIQIKHQHNKKLKTARALTRSSHWDFIYLSFTLSTINILAVLVCVSYEILTIALLCCFKTLWFPFWI